MSAGEIDADEEKESVTLFPLLGYATHSLPGALVMVTLELPLDPAKPTEERQRLAIGLRAIGARQLAESLVRAAQAAEMGQAPTKAEN
jgi:hypothetical protein